MQAQVFRDQPSTNPLVAFSQFWQDARAIAGSYWYPTEPGLRAFSDVIRAWGMLIFLILLIIALVGITASGSFLNRYVLNIVIEEKHISKYLGTLWISILVIVVETLLIASSKFVINKIALDWYKWLNNHILEKYFSNRLISDVMLKIIPDTTGLLPGSVELGYRIVPSHQQQGYASEAAKVMVDWAFCQPSVNKVTAGCNVDNIGVGARKNWNAAYRNTR